MHALRVGGDEQLDNLIAFAKRKDVDNELRAEALATLGSWANPSVLDRVDGRYSGVITRNPEIVKTKIKPQISSLLQDRRCCYFDRNISDGKRTWNFR